MSDKANLNQIPTKFGTLNLRPVNLVTLYLSVINLKSQCVPTDDLKLVVLSCTEHLTPLSATVTHISLQVKRHRRSRSITIRREKDQRS